MKQIENEYEVASALPKRRKERVCGMIVMPSPFVPNSNSLLLTNVNNQTLQNPSSQ